MTYTVSSGTLNLCSPTLPRATAATGLPARLVNAASQARCKFNVNKVKDTQLIPYHLAARRSALARNLFWRRGCLWVYHVDVLCLNDCIDHHATFTRL